LLPRSVRDRAVFDASALLGGVRTTLVAAVETGYCTGIWSSWIIAEFVRKRTEWIAERALREGSPQAELRRRLQASRQRVNRTVEELSQLFELVDYTAAPSTDLSWLADPDDWPVMQTALAAGADVLVTDNSSDFPLGQRHNGILLLGSRTFLERLYARFPDAEEMIQQYIRG
jgi:predicted nucleic acid-binding protein